MSAQETLPCPFCGSLNISDGENLIEAESHGVGRVTCTQSECLNCGACGPLSQPVHGPDYGDVAAIAAWNRRAPTPAQATSAEAAGSNCYVQTVPDHCDRIVWRNSYYHLPIKPAPLATPPAEASAEVVERVAKELQRFDLGEGASWESAAESTRDYFRRMARTALAAAPVAQEGDGPEVLGYDPSENERTATLRWPSGNVHSYERVDEKLVDDMEELLTSARCIAARRGSETAWDRFDASIAKLGIGNVTARTYRVLPDDATTPPPSKAVAEDAEGSS